MFKKKKENFKCDNCGFFVVGDGYTNHCPECLWSKHVDNEPGDRSSLCGGMMKPIDIRYSVSEQWLIHKCIVCGLEKKNKINNNDNFNTMLDIFS